MRASSVAASLMGRQRGALFPWVPVALGSGIAAYFAIPWEPPVWMLFLMGVLVVIFGGIAARLGDLGRPVLIVCACLSAGYGIAGARANLVEAPVLGFRYYGPIEGRIVMIDRSSSDKMRLTLDRVVLLNVAPDRTPAHVRVSLHHAVQYFDPAPGQHVAITGHLSPPEGPVEPGGFDFQRKAFFDRIGAVGYARLPLVPGARGPPDGWSTLIHSLRHRMSSAIQARIPGEAGAFAAAILTGDRSGIAQTTLQALRDTNLAHLLAISGLHMGLLTGVVFGALRLALALWPRAALTLPIKKIAAVAAILAGAGYYALSGGNVATERAFIMVSVAFTAILLDRRALTLRAVAIAALIVLALRPEAVTGPGFQMSFAATAALVGAFAALRDVRTGLPKWMSPVLAVVLSSVVAGAATAPFAAAHFNRLSDYGLIANLACVPLMGVWVMPAAVLAAAFWPLGLSGVGLWLMKWPILWILGVAETVAGLEGAVTPVPSPPSAVLPLIALGGCLLVLWQGRGRWVGAAPLLVASTLWGLSDRPDILISPDGGLIGVMTTDGRSLSKPRGQGFAAEVWLENDGDGAERAEASVRIGYLEGVDWIEAPLGEDGSIRQLAGRDVETRAALACAEGVLLVSARVLPPLDQGCAVLDEARLRETGAIAIRLEDGAPKITTAREVSGERLWNRQ